MKIKFIALIRNSFIILPILHVHETIKTLGFSPEVMTMWDGRVLGASAQLREIMYQHLVSPKNIFFFSFPHSFSSRPSSIDPDTA